MFSKKIFRVALGVATAEGWSTKPIYEPDAPGGESYRHHNPGNLRGSWLQDRTVGGFAVFENDMIGFMALIFLLHEYATGKIAGITPVSTLEEAFATYTALQIGSEELGNYLDIIKKFSGLSKTSPISAILD